MDIDLSFDSSVGSAPAGFVAAVDYVVGLYDALFPVSVTVDIDVGYGEIDGQRLGSDDLGESETNEIYASYAQVVSALNANATTAEAKAADATLPANNPTGSSDYAVATAEAKVLGLESASADVDGYVGFSSSVAFTYNPNDRAVSGKYDFIGTVEHEITEVLGRFAGLSASNGYSILDLFRYSAAGVRSLSQNSSNAYFSIDSGNTDLDNFNTNPSGDLGDWAASAGDDSFLAFSDSGVENGLSATDLTVMDVLGYGATPVVSGAVTGDAVTSSGTVTISGSEDDLLGDLVMVKVYDGSTLLGSASVDAANGTWTLTAAIAAGTHADVYAVATDSIGETATLTASFTLVTGVSGQAYSAYQYNYNAGQYIDAVYDYTSVSGQPYASYSVSVDAAGDTTAEDFYGVSGSAYSSYEYDYSNGNFIGSKFFYTGVTGEAYAGSEYDYDGGGNVTRAAFTGVSGASYSSYAYDYVGGVFSGSEFTFAAISAKAYSAYETDYDYAGAFTGDKFFFTDIADQAYTGEEEDYDASGNLSRVVITGVTSQAYSSLEEDYSAGTYTGYKAFYTGITDESYTGEEVDVSAANQITKVVYSGMSSTPYSSVEEDFSNGNLTGTVYDFTNVTGQPYYAYQVDENGSGVATQEVLDNTDGSHTIIGLGAADQTFTSIADDTFTGGGANETFVFQPIYGSDTITDFYQYTSGATHDTISLATSEFANFAAVTGAAANVGSNVVIKAADGDMLTLSNLSTSTLADLSADFTFHV
jgi:hypothetical protein